ncbi:unnamed protein product [Staurois parvus]|uniref:Uncharacterized protein n=1 Tax=Staurois parvus TaxID=386267 RepID=A0ABN9HS80_9NEOB|nr:unnamed protein product [Staurois parvus]
MGPVRPPIAAVSIATLAMSPFQAFTLLGCLIFDMGWQIPGPPISAANRTPGPRTHSPLWFWPRDWPKE